MNACIPLLLLAVWQSPAQNPQRQRPLQVPVGVEAIRDVEYGTGGSEKMLLDLYVPKAEFKRPRPAVIFIHGGGWRGGSKFPPNPVVLQLAEKGFVSLSVEYRLTGIANHPAQIEDCKCAVRWLRAHADRYGVDKNRIGVWGTSAGGHLAALLGTAGDAKHLEGKGGWSDQPSRVHAVVSCFGPTDLTTILQQRGAGGRPNAEEGLVGGAPSQMRERALDASPIHYVTKDDPPFLFLHGADDRLVPPAQSQQLHEALRKVGVRSEVILYPGVGHALNAEGRAKIVEFFERELGK